MDKTENLLSAVSPARLCKAELCCGCGLCAALCPAQAVSMNRDEEGFAYPFIDETRCRHCGQCGAHCPAQAPPAPHQQIKTFGAFCRDDSVRMSSGSGGVFGALAKQVLDEGGLVCGAAFDGSWRLRHVCIESIADLPALLGSKYLQSDLCEVYVPLRLALSQQRKVLFAGTPCQVNAISNYCGADENLLLVSIICQGAPAPAVFDKYRVELEEAYQSPLAAINFRSKASGWVDYGVEARMADGRAYFRLFYQDPYMRLALSRMFNRPCCDCCFAKCDANLADITIGDFWAVQLYIRKYRNRDKRGFSLVLTSSEKGFAALKRLEKSGRLSYSKTSIRGMITYNPSLFEAQPHHAKRAEFFSALPDQTLRELNERFLDHEEYTSALPHGLLDILKK